LLSAETFKEFRSNSPLYTNEGREGREKEGGREEKSVLLPLRPLVLLLPFDTSLCVSMDDKDKI